MRSRDGRSPRPVETTGELFPEAIPEPALVREWVARVAVALSIDKVLDYAVPSRLRDRLRPGQQVRVPVGGRRVPGFVVSVGEEEREAGRIKPLAGIVESEPLLTPTTLELGLWVAEHYGAAPGEALAAVVPAPVRHGRKQRSETTVRLDVPAAAREWVEASREKPALAGRVRVLRELLKDEGPLPLADLQRRAGVSASPIRTLAREGLLVLGERSVAADPFEDLRPERRPPPRLTEDQERVLATLLPLLEERRGRSALLHGVTGSGKTEVYVRLMEAALERGRGAILLLPEIALTPQTVERLRARLPEVAVLHSNQSAGDRSRQWKRLRSGEVRVALGPRSAVFAPLGDVGVIIIDEEHETTFKQNQSPRYHTRDVAMKRAELEGALLVLGTATPSMEATAACLEGRAIELSLPERVRSRPMPECAVIDMRHEKTAGRAFMFSKSLLMAMEETLARREQVLLFLNRRGFSTTVLCRRCGWRGTCPHCDINLTHYRKSHRLLCHYCGHEEDPPETCPECFQPGVLFEGIGTERVAEVAAQLFPGASIQRMDGETLRRRGAAHRIFQDLKSGAIDVLVGTQVIAKGLDIPNISLVGVITADTALLVPDFRSAERTFQLLCQVAGRAGRGEQPGRVLIQTWSPDHYAIRAASEHDAHAFARQELSQRRAAGYPPFGHLLRIVMEGPRPEAVQEFAAGLKRTLEAVCRQSGIQAEILGPAPCPITVLRGQHRHHILCKASAAEAITRILAGVPRRAEGSVRVIADRDPVSLM